jgi:hypothetical protein
VGLVLAALLNYNYHKHLWLRGTDLYSTRCYHGIGRSVEHKCFPGTMEPLLDAGSTWSYSNSFVEMVTGRSPLDIKFGKKLFEQDLEVSCGRSHKRHLARIQCHI